MREIFLLRPDQRTTYERVVSDAPRRRQVVVLGEKGAKAHNRTARAHLRLEASYEAPYRLDQLAFSLTERHLLIFNVIYFVLVLLEELCVSFIKNRKCTLRLIVFIIAIYLRPDKATLDVLDLSTETIEDALNSLLFVLQAGGSCQHSQLFLLNFKCQLVAHQAQFLLEVHLVADGLLRLISQQC